MPRRSRDHISDPGRRTRLRFAVILTLVGALTALPACSSHKDSDDDDTASSTTRSTKPLPKPSAELTLKVGARTVESAGPDVALDPSVARDVVNVANAYIQTGVLDPLVEGETGDDFESLFGIGIAARVQPGQPDRAALTEEGSPRATGKARSLGAKVDLTGLADQTGAIVMVTGRVGFRITVPTDQGPLVINRVGDLVFAPASGIWLISGYTMLTSREVGGESSTTTASSVTPTTTTTGGTP